MAGAYVKLFGSILTSSIWCEAQGTRLVWITMLLLADSDGRVWGAVPGIARQAGVSLKAAREAIAVLEQSDPDSRSDEDEGRRIRAIPGGWQIINSRKYREMQADGSRKDLSQVRAAAGRRGARARWGNSKMANDGNPSQTMPEAEEESEKENNETASARARERPTGDGPRKNPLVADRVALETECLRLVREEAVATDRDPTEVMAERSKWRDTRKVNPAAMSEDRLLNTVLDLRKAKADRETAARPAGRPIEAHIVPAEELYERRRQERAAARGVEGKAGSDSGGGGSGGVVGGRDPKDQPDDTRTGADPSTGPDATGVPRANDAAAPTGASDRRQG